MDVLKADKICFFVSSQEEVNASEAESLHQLLAYTGGENPKNWSANPQLLKAKQSVSFILMMGLVVLLNLDLPTSW